MAHKWAVTRITWACLSRVATQVWRTEVDQPEGHIEGHIMLTSQRDTADTGTHNAHYTHTHVDQPELI